MSYQVLARKWRPQTFEEIRGQAHIVRALTNAISSGRVAHAYLFTGIRGVGKTSAARVLAKALNCAEGPTPTPCNRCDSCREITEGKGADVFEIDGASNTGVDDVRRLREAVRYPPVRGPYRIYVIDEVHMLSTAAFNALLKTLEEPPGHVVFIFATTDPHKIPVTILSRCQQFDFKRLSPRELVALLGDVARAEGVEVDEKSLVALAREADGSVRDAQSLLDQVISYAGREVRYEETRDVLGVMDRDLLLAVARAVVAREPRLVVEAMAEAERFGYDPRRFAYDLADVFRDLAVLTGVEGADELVDLAPEEVAEARGFLSGVAWEEVHALYDMLSRGLESLRTAPRPASVLEMTLLKMAKMPPVLALSEVLARAGGGGGDGPSPGREAAQGAREALDRVLGRGGRGDDRPPPGGARGAHGPATPPPPRPAPPPDEAPEAPRGAEIPAAGSAEGAPDGVGAPAPVSPGGGGGMPEREAADPEPPSEAPPAPAAETPPPSPPAGPEAPVDGGEPVVRSRSEVWNRLLAAAERANRPIWHVLKAHATLAAWDPVGAVAEVAFDDPNHDFFLRSKGDLLLDLLRGVAGPRARLELRCAEKRAGNGRAEETDRVRHSKREALEHPLVREAVEIFDGDVEEVRILKP